MGRIVLDVDRELAMKWKNSTQEQKDRLKSIFKDALELLSTTHHTTISEPHTGCARPSEKILKDHRKQVVQDLEKHIQTLDEASKMAMSNGLTPKILQQLLDEE